MLSSDFNFHYKKYNYFSDTVLKTLLKFKEKEVVGGGTSLRKKMTKITYRNVEKTHYLCNK